MKIHELRGATDLARQLREAIRVATIPEAASPPTMVAKCMVGSIDASLLSSIDGLDALILYLEGSA